MKQLKKRAPYSLADCPPGDCKAKLPYFCDQLLDVRVGEWKTLHGRLVEKTVSLKRGSDSNRYLKDTELSGAEFYPAAKAKAGNEGGES